MFTLAPGKGFTAASPDGRYSLNIRARIQLRDTFEREGGESRNDAQIRTLRLFLQGNVFSPDVKYVIQLAFGGADYEADSPSPIFDAFLEYVGWRDLQVRVGQYFVPFDRARTVREFALQFVGRQMVINELTLDRDLGIMLSSTDLFGLNEVLGYAVFVGAGDGRNRFPDAKNPYGPQRPGMLVVARLVLKPLGPFPDYDQEADLSRSPRPRLGIGVAGGYNLNSDRSRSTYGSTYTLGTFDYAHLAADLMFKWSGFSLLAEYVMRDADRNRHTRVVDGAEVTEFSRSGWGYIVQGGQMLTDKLEVVARWDDLHAFKGTDPQLVQLAERSGRQVGGGVNYYVNEHRFKFQGDYFYIFNRLTDQPLHAVRVQLDATF